MRTYHPAVARPDTDYYDWEALEEEVLRDEERDPRFFMEFYRREFRGDGRMVRMAKGLLGGLVRWRGEERV